MRVLTFMLTMLMFSTVEAALLEEPIVVAVMEIGLSEGTSDFDNELFNAGQISSEYIIARLIDKENITVIDKDLVTEKLSEENLNIKSLIDPDTARRIGEILGVRYLIYGNILDVTLAEHVEGYPLLVSELYSTTVEAHTMLRIMDVETGKILMAARGSGSSENYSFKAFILVDVGNFDAIHISVHNALRNAAFNAVDLLVQRLYGK